MKGRRDEGTKKGSIATGWTAAVGSGSRRSQIPRAARLDDFANYPPIGQDRLRRFGLDTAITRKRRADLKWTKTESRIWNVGCLVVGLLMIASMATITIAGLMQVGRWLFG